MTEQELSILLMMCGALQDISENTYDCKIQRQIIEVQNKIENLVTGSDIYSKLFHDQYNQQ